MPSPLRLMAILAHPDDESLGVGGTLAKYGAEGVETFLVTATRGQKGRFRGHRDGPEYPGTARLAEIREEELRAAASVLGVGDVAVLDYEDQELDRADHKEAVALIAAHIRRVRPQVVLTFGPDGAYGHPDHIAISQLTSASIVTAATGGEEGHQVAKLYQIAWSASTWDLYQQAFASVGCTVDGVQRKAVPWPEWALTTVIDARPWWRTVWRAVSCHDSQVASYERLKTLTDTHHEVLWGHQCFYRVFSLVNGGRQQETDLFEGLRDGQTSGVVPGRPGR